MWSFAALSRAQTRVEMQLWLCAVATLTHELFISHGFFMCVCGFYWFLYVASSAQRFTIKFRVTFTPINHRRGTRLKYCLGFSAILSHSGELRLWFAFKGSTSPSNTVVSTRPAVNSFFNLCYLFSPLDHSVSKVLLNVSKMIHKEQ